MHMSVIQDLVCNHTCHSYAITFITKQWENLNANLQSCLIPDAASTEDIAIVEQGKFFSSNIVKLLSLPGNRTVSSKIWFVIMHVIHMR